MNILRPDGTVYAKVYTEDGKLVIATARYNFSASLKLDAKAIPQLIDILKDLK